MSVETYVPSPENIRRPGDFEPGRIQGVEVIDPRQFDLTPELTPARIAHVDVYNPNLEYLEAVKPGRYAEIQDQESWMDVASRLNVSQWRNKLDLVYDVSGDSAKLNEEDSVAYGDFELRDRYFSDGSFLGDKALRYWRGHIPTAPALAPLLNPFNTESITNPKNPQEVAQTTQMTQEWMAACTDGQEIFHRDAIVVDTVGPYVAKFAAANPDKKIILVSVAGGTAISMMRAAMRSGVDPERIELHLIEGDENSAKMAFELAERIKFKGQLIHKKKDVFNPEDMAQIKRELDASEGEVVATDAVGIAEYSNSKLRKPGLVKRFGDDYMLYNPEAFIKSVMDLSGENGMVMVGQMLSTRPNKHFTRGVVSWPHITMRSVKTFAKVLQGGGADMSLSEMNITPRGAYAMAGMFKSRKAAEMAGLPDPELKIPDQEMTEMPKPALIRAIRNAGCIGAVGLGRRRYEFPTVEEQ
jgi:hypothetical protein